MKLKEIGKTLVALFLSMVALVACTDGNDWETDPSKAALFRVSNITVTPSAQTASVSWTATKGAEYYVVEVSTSPLTDEIEQGANGSIVFGEDKSITSLPATISGLTKETEYYIRVKAFGKGLQSKWAYKADSFETTEENILSEGVAEDGITGNSIRVTWDAAGLPVSHLVYEFQIAQGDEVTTEKVTRELTSAEKENQAAVINGLTPGTPYTLYIYNDDDLRGMTTATTEQVLKAVAEEEIIGGNVVLHWDANGRVMTHYGFLKQGEADTTKVALTDADVDASKVAITGLELGTAYTFFIYNGEAVYGAVQATTEQIMNAIADQNVTGSAITIQWTAGSKSVESLSYQPNGGVETKRALTSDEIAAGQATLTGLKALTAYTIRIYGADKVLRGIGSATTKENKIDLTGKSTINSVTFAWDATDVQVVSYGYAKGSEPSTGDYVLTAEQLSSRTVTVDGLEAGTAYTFVLFDKDGNKVSNPTTFTTKADPLAGYTKVTVTGIDEWKNVIAGKTADGTGILSGNVAVVIPSGTVIDNASSNLGALSANYTSFIVWGGDLESQTAKPTVGINQLSWASGANLKLVKFYNINFVGKSVASSGIFFYQNGVAAEVQRVEMEACDFSEFRYFLRSAKAKVCDNLMINNCMVTAQEGLLLNQSTDTAIGSSLKLTNSTVSASKGTVIRNDQNTPCAVTIDQCSIYSGGSGWIIRHDQFAATTISVTVSNTLIDADNAGNYNTRPDNIASENVFGNNASKAWLTSVTGTIFTDAANGDFTVKDAQYAAYGDPRWKK